MSDDLVKRLRAFSTMRQTYSVDHFGLKRCMDDLCRAGDLIAEAAASIEALEAEVSRLLEVVKAAISANKEVSLKALDVAQAVATAGDDQRPAEGLDENVERIKAMTRAALAQGPAND